MLLKGDFAAVRD